MTYYGGKGILSGTLTAPKNTTVTAPKKNISPEELFQMYNFRGTSGKVVDPNAPTLTAPKVTNTVLRPVSGPAPGAPTLDTSLNTQLKQQTPFPTYNPNLGALQAQLEQLMAAYGQQENALRGSYQTNLGQTETAYQNLLKQLAKQEENTRKDFGGARATIAEDAFTRGRNLANQLASRNLSASGLLQLGDVQNRMETGRQVSNVAGQYFKTQENLADNKEQGTQSYETAKRQLADSLANNLASLLTQKASTGLEGQAMMENLRQAAAASAQSAAQFSSSQNTTQLEAATSIDANNLYIANDTTMDFNQKLAMIKGQYASAGLPYEEGAAKTLLNNQAVSRYKALMAEKGYETNEAKQYKSQMIALGYSPSLFTPSTSASVNAPQFQYYQNVADKRGKQVPDYVKRYFGVDPNK